MRYTGTKFTEVEAAAIMATAHEHLRWRPEQHDGADQRDGAGGRFVVKTIERARIDAPVPDSDVLAPEPITEVWPADVIFDVVGEAMGKLLNREHREVRRALNRRNEKIEDLRREIRMLRDEGWPRARVGQA